MSRTYLVTISDDRFGRKNGLYAGTQNKIAHIIRNNPQLGIDAMKMWKREDIEATGWYIENKILLDNTDAARNGRAYKPFIILDALKSAENGDFIIYTDCSPEMWDMDAGMHLPYSEYNINVLHNLCKSNNDILTIFVKWDDVEIKAGQLGKHFHKYFTLNRCMDKMGLREYENSYMGASGMWCIRKTADTLSFVKEWLKWNCDEDCCSLGKIDVPDDYSFWVEEAGVKLGHRHDQSISGLLLNKRNAKLVDILYNDMSPYNFLQYTRTNAHYDFISSNPIPSIYIGDRVKNEKGVELIVFRIEDELYVVGKSEASCYATKKESLTKI